MKRNRILTVGFILLTIFSLASPFSKLESGIAAPEDRTGAVSWLSVNHDDECVDFWRATSFRMSCCAKARSYDGVYEMNLMRVNIFHCVQYEWYLQKHISATQPRKLFIGLGALII